MIKFKLFTEKKVWDQPNPNKGEGNKMTSSQRADAKRRAKAAGRPYPNLVDNMAAMKEAVDDEGSMAKGDLTAIAAKASELAKKMKKNKQLDGWVQSKITKADSYIGSVHDYLKYGKQEVDEANDGKTLGKPFLTPGGPKKRAVYVKNEKGNTIKVGFGDPNLSIKRDNPERKKSFRARHNCDNPGPRTKARYWSCKYWGKTPVSKMD
jgi:hypothetical protein